MEIVTLGDELLRKRSVLVNEIDRGTTDFIQAMFDTMYEGKGIGLAAVQVGHLYRIFITQIPKDVPRVFVNPEIIETSLEMDKFEEGCLSVPGINADIDRPTAVRVQAWNETGRPFTLSAEDLLARVIQHEMDHLNGKLFIDHLNLKKRERVLKEYDRQVNV